MGPNWVDYGDTGPKMRKNRPDCDSGWPRATSECILGVSAEREEIGAGVGHGDDGKLSTRQSNVG